MSEVPSTPPQLSCPDDTPADSLLERLRRITGLTELPPLREPPRTARMAAPPVDRLIPWVRDGFAALTAGIIALAVAAAAGTLWLCARTREGITRAKQWQRERASRAAKAKAAAVQEAAPANAPASNPGAATALPPQVRAPAIAVPAPVKDIQVSAERLAALADVPAPPVTASALPVAPARERAVRHRRRPLVAAMLVVLALPSLLLVKPVRYYFTSLIGWGNAVVIAGKDGWLFPRIESEAGVPPPLREIAAALQTHGAALIVVSVPAKSAVYPEMLTESGGGELQRHPEIAAALSDLTAGGARVIDLGPVLFGLKNSDGADGPVFNPEGSWWSPRGMAQSAFAAANVIQQQPGYASLPLRPAFATLQPCSSLATMGDLVRALDSTRMQSRYSPRSVPLLRLLTNEKKEPIAPDPASPVALLGGEPVGLYDDPSLGHAPAGLPDGQRSSAGFGQHLAWHLSLAMDLHITRDGGLRAARDWISSRTEDDRRKKKLVIWVLADRDLLHGE